MRGGKPLAIRNLQGAIRARVADAVDGRNVCGGAQRFSAADYVSRRLDTTWGDLFWALRDPKSDAYDTALMNLFRAVALVTRDPDASTYIQDIGELRSHRTPTYLDFHQRGWLDDRFTLTLIHLLDTWHTAS